MATGTIVTLLVIGFFAGMLSGFVGVGGGVIIVPALVYFMRLSQHEAIGTSLFILTLPVTLLGTMNFARSGHFNWRYGLIIASTFIIGGYVGSKLSLKLSPGIVKIVFGILMVYVAFNMIRSGINLYKNEE